MFLLRLIGQWYQQKKSTGLLAEHPITSEEIQQLLRLFLFSLIEAESRSRRTCWFSLGIKASNYSTSSREYTVSSYPLALSQSFISGELVAAPKPSRSVTSSIK